MNPNKHYWYNFSEDCAGLSTESDCHSAFTKIDTTGANQYARCKWNSGLVQDWPVEPGWQLNTSSWAYANYGSWEHVSNGSVKNCSTWCSDSSHGNNTHATCSGQVINTQSHHPIFKFNGQKKTHGVSIPSCNGCTGANGSPDCTNIQGFCTVDFSNKYTDTSCHPII